jgi:hypothetical protein
MFIKKRKGSNQEGCLQTEAIQFWNEKVACKLRQSNFGMKTKKQAMRKARNWWAGRSRGDSLDLADLVEEARVVGGGGVGEVDDAVEAVLLDVGERGVPLRVRLGVRGGVVLLRPPRDVPVHDPRGAQHLGRGGRVGRRLHHHPDERRSRSVCARRSSSAQCRSRSPAPDRVVVTTISSRYAPHPSKDRYAGEATTPHLGGEHQVDLPWPELLKGTHRDDDGTLEAHPIGVEEEPTLTNGGLLLQDQSSRGRRRVLPELAAGEHDSSIPHPDLHPRGAHPLVLVRGARRRRAQGFPHRRAHPLLPPRGPRRRHRLLVGRPRAQVGLQQRPRTRLRRRVGWSRRSVRGGGRVDA